jgi:hypothetical protein
MHWKKPPINYLLSQDFTLVRAIVSIHTTFLLDPSQYDAPRGDATPNVVDATIVRSRTLDLGFCLDHFGRERENCFIDACKKGTTPVNAIIDDSSHCRSTILTDSLPAQPKHKNRPATVCGTATLSCTLHPPLLASSADHYPCLPATPPPPTARSCHFALSPCDPTTCRQQGGSYNNHPQQQWPYRNEVRISNLKDKIYEPRRVVHQFKLSLMVIFWYKIGHMTSGQPKTHISKLMNRKIKN